MILDDVDVDGVPRETLPRLLGRVVEIEAKIRLRLAGETTPAPVEPSRILDADEAAAIAGTSRRWLLAHTRGLRFRMDLSRKQARFEEGGLRAWIAGRRR